MKKELLSAFFMLLAFTIYAQMDTSQAAFGRLNFQNYSTSFISKNEQKTPFLIVARYNPGMYTAGLDMEDAFPQFRNERLENSDDLSIYDTNDSSEVYFIAANIFRNNDKNYEFRVLENQDNILRNWQSIKVFLADSIQLNNFKTGMGFIGGFKTTWNNYIIVEIRDKKNGKIVAKTAAYWQQVKPEILNVYTPSDLNLFLKRLKSSYEWRLSEAEKAVWAKMYKPIEMDTTTFLPKKMIFEAKEDNIIFYLKASIYTKSAVEYRVLRNGKTYQEWQANDFDNNFIWLKNLKQGSYELQFRLAIQRHNVSVFTFDIKPEWYQTPKMQFLWAFLSGVLVLLIYYLFAQRRKIRIAKKEKERIDAALKSIRAQLNPHFVFNALNSIQGLVNQNKINEANYYLTAFSRLLRESLQNSDKEFVPLSWELKTLETYIKLENLRFPFVFSLEIDKNLNTNDIEVPYLLLQPLVENAIKYGVSGLYEKGELSLHIYLENTNLNIKISDNGKGFDPQNDHKGYGLKLTKERIWLLNQSNPEQAVSLSIDSDKTGTKAHLIFKNWL